jgi:hypothetical protein
MMGPPLILNPGENTRIDVHRDLDGGAMLMIVQPKATTQMRLSRDTAIGMALALLEAAGVPIQETYRRQQEAQRANGG